MNCPHQGTMVGVMLSLSTITRCYSISPGAGHLEQLPPWAVTTFHPSVESQGLTITPRRTVESDSTDTCWLAAQAPHLLWLPTATLLWAVREHQCINILSGHCPLWPQPDFVLGELLHPGVRGSPGHRSTA